MDEHILEDAEAKISRFSYAVHFQQAPCDQQVKFLGNSSKAPHTLIDCSCGAAYAANAAHEPANLRRIQICVSAWLFYVFLGNSLGIPHLHPQPLMNSAAYLQNRLQNRMNTRKGISLRYAGATALICITFESCSSGESLRSIVIGRGPLSMTHLPLSALCYRQQKETPNAGGKKWSRIRLFFFVGCLSSLR